MSSTSGAERAELAERCAARLGMPMVDDVPAWDPLEQVVSRCSTEQAWLLRPGMRLRLPRKFLLAMLRPFTERQEIRDELSVLALSLMSDEILRLRAVVARLEEQLQKDESDGGAS